MSPRKVIPLQRWELVSVFALMVVSMFLAVYLVDREANHRTSENRALIEQNARTRAALLAGLKETDRHTCLEIEKLKTGFREEALRNYSDLAKNAKLLNIALTPDLIAAATQARDRTLLRYAPRPHGCGKLAPENVPKTQGG